MAFTSKIERSKRRSKVKQAAITAPYTRQIGKDFIPLASFSYCTETQMANGKCCENSLPKDYIVDLSGKVVQDDYTFAILRSDVKQRVVISLTGTKANTQLLKEAWYSNSVVFGDPAKKMYISNYFKVVFDQVKAVIKPKLLLLKKAYPAYQYIFTGHSLGGAMSTIFAVDSVLDGYVAKTATSPALINFASPRVGNFVFASYVMLNVPVIFRVVRDGDPVVSIPPCSYVMKCSNGLGKEKFSNLLSDISGPAIPDDKGFWHIAGIIMYKNDMSEFEDCGRVWSENNANPKCVSKFSLGAENHTSYLMQSVSGVCQGAAKYLFSKKYLKQYLKAQKMKNLKKKKVMKKRNKKF
jgi:hypothetical protein